MFCIVLSESSLSDLAEALQVLPAPDTRSLAKTLHLGAGPGGGSATKEDLVQAILKHSRRASITNFFSAGGPKARTSSSGTADKILKRSVRRAVPYKL